MRVDTFSLILNKTITGDKRIEHSFFRVVVLFTIAGLVLTACGGASDGETPETEGGSQGETTTTTQGEEFTTIEWAAAPSSLALIVAQEEGLIEGDIVLQPIEVGYDQETSLFLTGDLPIGMMSPQEAGDLAAEGEDVVFFSTANALNSWNGLVIRTEDEDQYNDAQDLVGKKLAQPGFGSSTWLSFAAMVNSQYGIDAQSDYEVVTADPGALLGLLSAGEVDAVLVFAPAAAAAMASDEFVLLGSLTEQFSEISGQPLVNTGLAAHRSWLEEHPHEAAAVVKGVDKAIQWIGENPDAVRPGGKYATWAEGQGWHSSEAATERIIELWQNGEWVLTSESYTDEWIDATYELIKLVAEAQGHGEPPPKDEIFFSPEDLPTD